MIRRMPIRWRLALAFAAAMAILLAGGGVFLRLSLADRLDESIAQSLRSRGDEVAALVAAEGTLAVPGGARLAEPDDSFAQVLDSRGGVLDASLPALVAPLLDADTRAAALSGPLTRVVTGVPGTEHRSRLLARPVGTGGEARLVVVGATLEDRDEAVGDLTTLLIVAGPVALIVASILGFALAGAALRPVEAMRAAAAGSAGSRDGGDLPLPLADDEIRRLGQTLNAMLRRDRETLERERAFVADASHELRTPISVLKAEIELALSGERTEAELRAALASAAEETERLARLADDLLVLARASEGGLPVRRERLDAGALLRRVATRFAARAAVEGRAIRVGEEAGVEVFADPQRLEQVAANLIDNALVHGGGVIEITAARVDGGVRIDVADEGPGFDEAVAGRVFERFARGRASRGRSGAGLGLSIVDAIVRAHGGSAAIAGDGGRGALVSVWLPDDASGATR